MATSVTQGQVPHGNPCVQVAEARVTVFPHDGVPFTNPASEGKCSFCARSPVALGSRTLEAGGTVTPRPDQAPVCALSQPPLLGMVLFSIPVNVRPRRHSPDLVCFPPWAVVGPWGRAAERRFAGARPQHSHSLCSTGVPLGRPHHSTPR